MVGLGYVAYLNDNTFAFQRAVKFMYTGQLKMTKSEIDNDHLVWHVNHILLQLFRVDAKLNLPLHLLVPPTASGDEDDGAGGTSLTIDEGEEVEEEEEEEPEEQPTKGKRKVAEKRAAKTPGKPPAAKRVR